MQIDIVLAKDNAMRYFASMLHHIKWIPSPELYKVSTNLVIVIAPLSFEAVHA